MGYSLLHGVGQLPVTGGLFLGEDTEELESTEEFPLTQDQRHTIRGRATYQFSPSTWIAVAGSFGSGLPFEDFEGTPEEAAEQFGQKVVDRVNFETGRVRPNASLDIAAGVTVAQVGDECPSASGGGSQPHQPLRRDQLRGSLFRHGDRGAAKRRRSRSLRLPVRQP